MEGTQAGCYEIHQLVCDLSAKQVRAYTSNMTTSTTSHSRAEMGEHIDGLHHRPTQGSG
jgi:hypothetical protein